MRIKLYVPDIECESCVKVLERRFAKVQGVHGTKFSEEAVEVDYDEAKIKTEEIIDTIKNAGYRAATHPFEKKSFRERGRHFLEQKAKYELEYKLLKYTLGIFFILTILETIAYIGFLKQIPLFAEKYTWWLFYLNISVATLAVAVWHFSAYKAKVTTMLGMMVGMTIGMQTGMMLGAVFGATNGLFIGSVVGVVLAVSAGVYVGKCCGISGILQGMMSGLMGGVMGPMVTLLLFADHLLWFMPLYTIINVLILWGFSYMIYEEVVEDKIVIKKPMDFYTLASASIILTSILVTIIIYGIKSPLVAG